MGITETREELEAAAAQSRRWTTINFLTALMTGLTVAALGDAGELREMLMAVAVGVPAIVLTWRRSSVADRRYEAALQRAFDELMR